MTAADEKATLQAYLQQAREALPWKLDGLDEYDVRRPMTPTGTNLLGIVKHLAMVEAGYFGSCFGRPVPDPAAYWESEADNEDMWATAEQSPSEILALYQRVWRHSNETIDALPLDAKGYVPWWPPARNEPTLHTLLIHMISETHRHLGHADIVRESIDGSVGHRADNSNLPELDGAQWRAHYGRLESLAQQFKSVESP